MGFDTWETAAARSTTAKAQQQDKLNHGHTRCFASCKIQCDTLCSLQIALVPTCCVLSSNHQQYPIPISCCHTVTAATLPSRLIRPPFNTSCLLQLHHHSLPALHTLQPVAPAPPAMPPAAAAQTPAGGQQQPAVPAPPQPASSSSSSSKSMGEREKPTMAWQQAPHRPAAAAVRVRKHATPWHGSWQHPNNEDVKVTMPLAKSCAGAQ